MLRAVKWGLPEKTRQDLNNRIQKHLKRIGQTENTEDFSRNLFRLAEIDQAERKNQLESVRVALEIEKFEAGRSDTQINVTQQVAIIPDGKRELTPAEEAAAMDATVLPPAMTLFGKKINTTGNGHFGGEAKNEQNEQDYGNDDGQHDANQ